MNILTRWKAQPVEYADINHGYSLSSEYYECKRFDGVMHYKITTKGIWKLKEGRLNALDHNFMVYLFGWGERKLEDYPS